MPTSTKECLEKALDIVNDRLTEKLQYQLESHHVLNIAKAEGAADELIGLKVLILNELEKLNPVNPNQLKLEPEFIYKGNKYLYLSSNANKTLWKHDDHYVITKNNAVVFSGNYEAALTWLDK